MKVYNINKSRMFKNQKDHNRCYVGVAVHEKTGQAYVMVAPQSDRTEKIYWDLMAYLAERNKAKCNLFQTLLASSAPWNEWKLTPIDQEFRTPHSADTFADELIADLRTSGIDVINGKPPLKVYAVRLAA